MSKRFTDNTIWEKPWFRKLPCVEKEAWRYICDKCDPVGVWDADTEIAEIFIGAKVDWAHLRQSCNGNIEVLPNGKWFLPDFCAFQYGELSEECRPHKSYLALLQKHGLKGYKKGFQTLKEKEKDKEQEKDKEKESYAEGVRMTKAEFSALVGQYGEATVKLAIQKVAAQQIKTGKPYKSPRGAVLQWGIRAALEEIKKGGGPKQPADYCPECGVAGGNHGVKCSRKVV